MNPYMPTNFRTFCGAGPRINYADLNTYVLLYPEIERLALMNNIKAARWSLGYVPEVHELFLSSGIGVETVNVLVDKMLPSKAKVGGKDPQIEQVNEMLEKHLSKNVKKLIKQATQYGSALGRICFNSITKNAYIDSVPLGRFRVDIDESERVIKSTCYLESKKATEEGTLTRYVLIERRYFDNENKPKAYYGVIKMMFNSLVEDASQLKTIEFDKKNLTPLDLRHLQGIYPDYPLYNEVELPFDNYLGVELFNYTETNSKFPNCWFGEAMLSDVGDSLYAYDHAFTAKENDKYLGRGRALIPFQFQNDENLTEKKKSIIGSMTISSIGGSQEAPRIARRKKPELDKTFYDEIAQGTGEPVRPTSIQFNLRTVEWREELNGALGDIASRVGISAVDLDTRLNGSQQRTATEVNRDSDKTLNTASAKKELFTPGLDTLIECLVHSLGDEFKDIDCFIEWPKQGLANPQVQTQVVREQYDAHLISRETAIKRLNPEWSDAEVKEEIKRIEAEENAVPEDNQDSDLTEVA
nr:MAG TPA: portal protein [Caudoviricetes sp.]